MAAGSRVLNVGAAGNARYYKEHGTGGWLHKRLADRAAGLIGLDIDEAEIAAARNIGFDIIAGDCETVTLGETFDLIVLSDVIEHVGNPGMALTNTARHLAPGGQDRHHHPQCHIRRNLSKSAMRPFAECLLGSVALYTPEHIQAVCDRHGYRLQDTAFFTLSDRRTPVLRVASAIVAALALLWPRFHASFLCVVSAGRPAA